jgi:hypothetical protein
MQASHTLVLMFGAFSLSIFGGGCMLLWHLLAEARSGMV